MRASVVIRVRDEAAALDRLLSELAAQTADHEVVVVDSGSRDASPDVARAAGARVLEIPARTFTFGRALNLGAGACGAETIVALSAHAYPRDAGWLERMAAALDDPQVACAFGPSHDARGRPLTTPVRQDAALVARQPFWGYSNGAGAFRAALWRERGFREDLPGSEDREWALWALGAGSVCVLDPALAVDHDHSRDSLRQSFRRYAREARGETAFLDLPPYRLRDAAGEWWSDQGGTARAPARAWIHGAWPGWQASGGVGEADDEPAGRGRSVSDPWRFEWRARLLGDELRATDDWLDLGCGTGRFLALAPGGVGVDPDPASPGLPLDDGALPLAHASVDLVWCSEVLEHVADPLALLFEARRVLRPGGRLLLTTPAHPLARRVAIAALRFDEHFDPMGGHLRFFTRRSLTATLAAAHFADVQIRTRHATLVARAVRA